MTMGRDARLPAPAAWEWAIVCAATLLGLWLRLFALDVVGLWWDEFVTLGRAAWPLADMLPSLAFQGPSDVSLDSSPPLFHLLVHAALRVLPATDATVKLPSLAAGTLTIPVVWLLGRRLFSRETGLAAAVVCAVSLFPIHYSREARPYALYLLCALAGFLFLLRAMDSGRRRDWAGFVLANAAMFYASYLASATFAAEGLIVCGRAALLWRADRPAARRLCRDAALAAGLVVLAYLPWVPGHLFQVRTIHSDGPTGDRFASAGFSAVLRAFTAMHDQSGLPWPAILGGLATLGLARHLLLGRWRSLAALAVWAGCALAMAAALPTQIDVSIRYLVNLFFLYAYLAAGGAEALAALPGRFLPNPPAVLAPVLAAALALGCGWPMAAALPVYVKRDSPSIKSALADLAIRRDGADWLFFYRNRHLKIIAEWYLGDTFRTAASLSDRAYRRFLLLTPHDLTERRALPGLVPVRETFWADVARGGAVNRAPLPLDVPYAADFSDLAFFADVFAVQNLAPDLGYATLALYDCRLPGRAVFAFALPPGSTAGKAPVRVTLALRPGKAGLPEAGATVLTGTDPGRLSPAARATARDFGPGRDRLDLDVALPPPDPATGLTFLAVEIVAGHVDGFLELAGLRVTPPTEVRLPPGAPALWQRRAAAVAANTPVLPGLGEARAALGGATLFGFADAPDPVLRLGGPEDLAAYLRAYPDDAPVATVADATGAVRVRYFDPGLRHPLAGLAAAPRELLPGFGRPVTAKGLIAAGNVAGQTLRFGQAQVQLPVAGPAGSRLLLGADGRGLLHFSPTFDRPLPRILDETFVADAVAAAPGEPALTCSGDAPCFFTYAVTPPPGEAGTAAPIEAFRLAWYPQVLTDGTGHNRVTVAYSTDGSRYEPLGELRSEGDFFWYGGEMRMAREVRLPQPADRLYLRFALSGAGARLWSAPGTPLSLDVTLAGTGFAGLPLPQGPVAAASPDGDVLVRPTLAPPALGLSLRERL
ncbi:glycosyltransferase family 39 protein [Solidesulfovibrio sp.]|uniref:glycosyltransferase family 39 protein n=1 Tax=Solidesulfovibrio sp. TaxID=2910990 RepID=UPI0026324E5A|nr:glycosyltransferase family 39 protein [Solidesulfovibrio sp.]